MNDYGLELLLDYDGKRHFFATGHYLKFDIRPITPSVRVPHGLAYSLTLHAPDNSRILGFDNAHPVPHAGSRFVPPPSESDHWHRDENDEGRPYAFKDASQLLVDFFDAVESKLMELSVPNQIVGDE